MDVETKAFHLSYQDQMQHDGVVIIKNQIDKSDILSMKQEIDKIRKYVMQKIVDMQRPLATYTDIAERQLNRLDYRCGFNATLFQEVAKPIIKIVQSLSPRVDFMHYWGAIPSLPGAGPTDMHRDIYPVFNDMNDNDINEIDLELPPYYFTVLIPLIEITKENGPTQFIKSSHRYASVDETRAEVFAPLISPGDLVIFDGRTLHKGSANNSTEERLIAYITFTAKWYYDQTFVMNNYLFPELCTKVL